MGRDSPRTEIDRRFESGPFRLGHWRVSTQQIIKSEPGPPGNGAPTFDAHQPGDLLMHLEGCEEVPDIQRNAQAGSKPVESQPPLWNIAGVWGGSVVIVPERSN